MISQFILPPEILRNYVRYFWVLNFDTGNNKRRFHTFADRYPSLTFQCLDGHSHVKEEKGAFLPVNYLRGAQSKPLNYLIRGPYAHIHISLYPYALKRFLNIDAFEVTNQLFDLLNFCPRDLIDGLYDAKCSREKIKLLTNFLIAKIQLEHEEDKFEQDAFFWLQNNSVCRVHNLLQRYNISERQLQRKFKASFGVSPKKYLSIMRFGKALEVLQTSSFDKLSDIAFELNYADQSHFTREFKNLSKLTPKMYLNSKKLVKTGNRFLEG